jgi:hypothetical protein
MKTDIKQQKEEMRKIFTYMLENGYNPTFEDNYILFDIEDNTSVLEYDEGILSIRTFFTIDEDGYDIFLEASNLAMINSLVIRPVIMEDMKSIMFSCETICDNMNDFKRFFPKLIEFSKKGLEIHKHEMKELIQATEILNKTKPATEDMIFEAGKSVSKLLS